MKRGDVVTLQFPSVETSMPLSPPKIRPVVVVSTEAYTQETGNVLVAMITSKAYHTKTDYELADWALAGLKRLCRVRMKIATVTPNRILSSVGSLTAKDLAEVDKRLRLAMGL